MQSFLRAMLPALVLLATPAAWAGGAKAAAETAANGGTLVLQTTTIGADVVIDGEKVGVTPLAAPLPLSAQEHTVKITKPGYAPFLQVIRVQKKKATKLEVELDAFEGVLRVRASVANSRVFVDGKFVGEAPLETELPVGARAIQVSHGGYKDFFQNVEAVAGQEVALEVSLVELPPEINPYIVKAPPPPKWYQKWWVWTVGLVGVGAVVTAVTVPVVITQRNQVNDFHASYTYTVMGGHVTRAMNLGVGPIAEPVIR